MASATQISKKRKFVADGVFQAELGEFLCVSKERKKDRETAARRQMGVKAMGRGGAGSEQHAADVATEVDF
jgi:hypothetical protein